MEFKNLKLNWEQWEALDILCKTIHWMYGKLVDFRDIEYIKISSNATDQIYDVCEIEIYYIDCDIDWINIEKRIADTLVSIFNKGKGK